MDRRSAATVVPSADDVPATEDDQLNLLLRAAQVVAVSNASDPSIYAVYMNTGMEEEARELAVVRAILEAARAGRSASGSSPSAGLPSAAQVEGASV
ncbi:MAG TPA: hypothetical protein VMK83_02660 [Gaiellaceae bacterium]|nr:hypothetical protein [Gaiellaceae bacterium]